VCKKNRYRLTHCLPPRPDKPGNGPLRRSKRPLIIASRKSALARIQAQAVGQALARLNPTLSVIYKWIESEGDQLLHIPLTNQGGKGLFAKAVELALLEKKADIAVHSLKDLPVDLTPGLTISAIPQREDVRDCLVSQTDAHTLLDLPPNAVVGSASPRRAAQLLRIRPDIKITLIRGNVETRLRKVLGADKVNPHIISPIGPTPVDIGPLEYHATLLAVAGLNRLGLSHFAAHPIDTATMLPASAQGALAIQCRSDDHVTLSRTLVLNDPVTSTAVHAERNIVELLEGDCHSPIAALVTRLSADRYRLEARVIAADGKRMVQATGESNVRTLGKAVQALVADLKSQGAKDILQSATDAS
jgi:hydroxymethylbilane synthase